MITGLLLQRARRRRVEAELEESQHQMELAASAAEFGMWGHDLSDRRVWANAPLRALFGLGPEGRVEIQRSDGADSSRGQRPGAGCGAERPGARHAV